MMFDSFLGRTAVITGSASGIGLALARHAISLGMNVVMVDLDQAALDEASGQLAGSGRVLACKADVSMEDDLLAVRQAAIERFGPIHLLFNNAGVLLAKSTWSYTTADWAWILGVNLGGVTNGTRAFLPHMREHGQGAWIVNTASVAGFISPAGLAAYNASKQAVVAVSETLQAELKQSGERIGVSVLCPAWVATQIGNSERIRPGRYAPYHLELSKHDKEAQDEREKSISTAISKGKITAEDIAMLTFSAIARKQFYIFPHPRIFPSIEERFETIRSACMT